MKQNRLEVSVVMPTCRRAGSLQRALDGLARQDLAPERFEVIVVMDGLEDPALELLNAYRSPLRLRYVQQSPSGAGAARNRGAELASGRLLLFLDDDVEAGPGLIGAHLVSAAEGDGVSLGYLAPVIPKPHGFLALGVRNWWEEKFHQMRQPAYRFGYADLLSGHVSIPAHLFRKLNGFDASFLCREDYELGARLIKSKVPFRFLDGAYGWHYETPDLKKSFARSKLEGAADVRLAQRHPEVIPTVAVTGLCQQQKRNRPRVDAFSETWARLLERTLPWLERLNLRQAWHNRFRLLKRYWYLRGARSECPHPAELTQWLQPPPQREPEPLSLELALGLEQAEAELESRRPASVFLYFEGFGIGRIPPAPLAEPVRGRHLREVLRKSCGYAYLNGLAWNRLTGEGDMTQCSR